MSLYNCLIGRVVNWGLSMNRTTSSKFSFGSAGKQIACLSLAASLLVSPMAAIAADDILTDSSVKAPVTAVTESDVENILVPTTPVAPTETDVSQSSSNDPSVTESLIKADAEKESPKEEKSTGKKNADKKTSVKKSASNHLAKLRGLASRVKLNRDGDKKADSANKKIASSSSATTTSSLSTPSLSIPPTSEATTPTVEVVSSPAIELATPTSEATTPAEKTSTQSAGEGWNSSAAKEPNHDEISAKMHEKYGEDEHHTAKSAEVAAATSSDTSTSEPSDSSKPTSIAAVEPVTEATSEESSAGGASVGFELTSQISSLESLSKLSPDGVIIVDNDEAVQNKATLEFEEMPTDDGKTIIKTGARFPVVISSQLNSKSSKKGDAIEARLKYDLKIGDRLVAKKGSVVRGHINYSLKARTILHSMVSPERWYRNSGCIGIDFDEIINERGEHIPCNAAPSRAGRVIKNKAEGRELGVNHNGQVTGPWAQQIRYKAVRVGLNFAMAPAGVFSFGAMPVALGVLGAANPNFAFSRPVGLNVRHRRIKGFAWGFLSGIPGSWLIEDTTLKGQEAIIKPGDEFYAEFKQEFNGKPETDASILAGASTKVRGQVVSEKQPTKK